MKILILGSEGFIGSHLIRFYLSKKFDAYGADLFEVGKGNYSYRKITRFSPEFDELLQQTSFDVCINAAGSGNVTYSMSHPVIDFESNCLDTIRLLDALRRYQPTCKYLHISSAAVYGNPKHLPVQEDQSLTPISAYGWHKLMSEKIGKEYASIYQVPVAIARPFSVFGPGLKKQLFWDIYRKCLQVEEGGVIQLWGSGRESRDFIYIDDLVNSFNSIITHGAFRGEEYNVAGGEEVQIKVAVEVFLKEAGLNRTIFFDGNERLGDPQNWCADISRTRVLGFSPEVKLNVGLKRVAEWLKSQN